MLTTPFEDFPDSARVWVYGSDRALGDSAERDLLAEVDNYLTNWTAHGSPLSAARNWRDGRFLTIAVDQEQAGASGCSIDELFRALKSLEWKLGASIVTSGLIFYRGRDGKIRSVTREEFADLGASGEVDGEIGSPDCGFRISDFGFFMPHGACPQMPLSGALCVRSLVIHIYLYAF